MLPLGEILYHIRVKILDWGQEELCEKLGGYNRKTYSSDERMARPDKIHGSVDFYERYKAVMGIDLYRSVTAGKVIITDPTLLPSDKIQALKAAGAAVVSIPLYNTGIMPPPSQEKYPPPAFLVPAEMYPGGEFGTMVTDNSMEPRIKKGDYIICGTMLTVHEMVSQAAYLLPVGEGNHKKFQMGFAGKKKDTWLLTPANPSRQPIPVTVNHAVHKIVGLYWSDL